MKRALACIVALAGALALARLHRPKPAASFDLEDLRGNRVTLESWRGRPVLLNFWATWCEPCRSELPELQAIAGDGCIAVVGIAVNSGTRDEVAAFAHTHGLDYPILMGDARVMHDYSVREIPRSLLFDTHGRKIGDWLGPIDHRRIPPGC